MTLAHKLKASKPMMNNPSGGLTEEVAPPAIVLHRGSPGGPEHGQEDDQSSSCFC
jgi:hypothetical protein